MCRDGFRVNGIFNLKGAESARVRTLTLLSIFSDSWFDVLTFQTSHG
jgi:hypothetical protein